MDCTTPPTNEILVGILDVLKQIDARLHDQHEQLQALTAVANTDHRNTGFGGSNDILSDSNSSATLQGRESNEVVNESGKATGDEDMNLSGRADEHLKTCSAMSTWTGLFPPKVLYTERYTSENVEKGIDFMGQLVDLDYYLGAIGISADIQEILGDWWTIPDDNRVRLTFSWEAFQKVYETSSSPFMEPPTVFYSAKRMREALQFDRDLRRVCGNDFLAVDFDEANNTRLYRLGQSAVGAPLSIISENRRHSPWSMLLVYQGATTGDSIKPHKLGHKLGYNSTVPISYFAKGNTDSSLWTHMFSHLQLKPRNISSNPYLDEMVGFHTTFYEIIKTKKPYRELWKNGPLYEDPLDRSFRKCAYIACFSMRTIPVFLRRLSPEGTKQTLGHTLGKLTKVGAEMNIIAHGLERISDRWLDFQVFFDYILDGGDSFMKPAEHDTLLFDDASFSRSRKYFWDIDCLSEFVTSITDNIHQWELFREARIESLMRTHALPDLDLQMLRNVEKQYKILINQRKYFQQKLASTVALRDALFNASTVIESRASTRLRENVKLLTFVSIFFLPLSFCTSLWSVKDMFSTNALLTTIILVGCSTYFLVLNINTLVRTTSRVYERQKRPIINAMKGDITEHWKVRAKRFEVFRPKHKRVRPSEWLVLLYLVRKPWMAFGLSGEDLKVDWGGLWRMLRGEEGKVEKDEIEEIWKL